MKKKLILGLVILIIVVIVIFVFFFQVWNEEHRIEEKMKATALEKVSKLVSIYDVDNFTGENHYYFIFGKNSLDQDVLVWINEEEVHSKYLYSWYTKDEIREKAELISPQNTIKRINGGIDSDDVLIYEILYEDEEGKLGYMYYNLLTGDLLKMYKLGKIN